MDSAVVKNKTVHRFIWNALYKVKCQSMDDRETIAKRIVGDFRRQNLQVDVPR